MTSDLTARLATELAGKDAIFSIRNLVLFFYGATRAASSPNPRDKAEARNVALLRMMCPEECFGLDGRVYKPRSFIHPFERWYSLPGYLDAKVLAPFYRAVDSITQSRTQSDGPLFIAFVYTFFLLVHPLVDANGRVVRSLLDYYNLRLNFQLKPVWNKMAPKFSDETFHAEAFHAFFQTELSLEPRVSDPYPMTPSLAVNAQRMAEYMIEWAHCTEADPAQIARRAHVSIMADGIREMASKG